AAKVPTKTGMTVIYATAEGKKLAESIIGANTIMPSRGARADDRSLAVPKYKNGTGVIVEVGFINSAADRQKINQSSGEIGKEIASGIAAYIRSRGK
ncbi:MAG TPA: N-acetylmuramoyl-L-alanine amidase, partial [Clostridia bacterium]|nr:N-acetylmuramoyl-L-alanine amidase [Clostridia bacterium]